MALVGTTAIDGNMCKVEKTDNHERCKLTTGSLTVHSYADINIGELTEAINTF